MSAFAPIKRHFGLWFIPLSVSAVIIGMGVFFFRHTQSIMQAELRDRLSTIAAVAAQQFVGDDLDRIASHDDRESAVYRDITHRLRTIRDSAEHVKFVYMLRRTDDPLVLAFVADADDGVSMSELDRNGDGTVESDEQPGLPGDLYYIGDVEALQHDAFLFPSADKDVTEDQWGRFISGYAPVYRTNGTVAGVLGIDVDADQFNTLSQVNFTPFAFILVVIAGLIMGGYLTIIIRKRSFEALQQLNEDRAILLDLISHQLGAPLATLRWWLEILGERKDKLSKKELTAYVEMKEGVDRMGGIMHAIAMAKEAESDDVCAGVVQTALDTIVNDAADRVHELMEKRGQRLHLSLPDDLPSIMAQPAQLTDAIAELIVNASVFSPNDADIHVVAFAQKTSITLEVRDHGCGIPPAELRTIGNKFVRGSNAARHKPVGNGLGLYTVKRAVSCAGGSMEITSRLGEGTTVILTFPIV